MSDSINLKVNQFTYLRYYTLRNLFFPVDNLNEMCYYFKLVNAVVGQN